MSRKTGSTGGWGEAKAEGEMNQPVSFQDVQLISRSIQDHLPISSRLPSPSLLFAHTSKAILASLLTLSHARHMPTSTYLHWIFLLPGILFIQVCMSIVHPLQVTDQIPPSPGDPNYHVHFFTF